MSRVMALKYDIFTPGFYFLNFKTPSLLDTTLFEIILFIYFTLILNIE